MANLREWLEKARQVSPGPLIGGIMPSDRTLRELVTPEPGTVYGDVLPAARLRDDETPPANDRWPFEQIRPAVPGMLRDFARAVKFPYDYAHSDMDPTSPEVVTRATESALALMGGGAFMRAPKDSLRSFATRTAETELPAATTPAEEQARAVLEMLRSGRASEVTDEMMAAADPQYLFRNYDLPMDEASRLARAKEMGFDTSPRREELPVSPEAKARLSEIEREIRAERAARERLVAPFRTEADALAREEYIAGKIRPSEMMLRRLELLDELSGKNPEVVSSDNRLKELLSRYRAERDGAEKSRTLTGMFHGSPDISWMKDNLPFDANRTHDVDLAYGRSPAYTTESPEVASAYTRPGTSWGNRNMERNPGVVPLFVRSKEPFDINGRFSAAEAEEILGPEAFSTLPDEPFYTGREVWDALVKDMPSYYDLELERKLFGGDIDGMLPKTEASKELALQGFDAIRHVDTYNPAGGGKHNVIIPFEGNQLRSRFARFDPRLSHLRNLNAANAAPELALLPGAGEALRPELAAAQTDPMEAEIEAYLEAVMRGEAE